MKRSRDRLLKSQSLSRRATQFGVRVSHEGVPLTAAAAAGEFILRYFLHRRRKSHPLANRFSLFRTYPLYQPYRGSSDLLGQF